MPPPPVSFGPLGRLSLHTHFHIMFAVLVFFLLSPRIDIGAAALFFDDEGGFFLEQNPEFQFLRRSVFLSTISIAVFSLVMVLAHPLRRQAVLWPTRIWAFSLTLVLLGPGLLVNGVLKAYWGRARPRQIEEFGGDSFFTPPFQIDGECLRNCSFVSGEGAGATALALIVLLLAWNAPWRWLRPLSAVLAGLILVFGAGLRVAMGGHFLSDVVLSILMVIVVAEILARLFYRFSPNGVPEDMRQD